MLRSASRSLRRGSCRFRNTFQSALRLSPPLDDLLRAGRGARGLRSARRPSTYMCVLSPLGESCGHTRGGRFGGSRVAVEPSSLFLPSSRGSGGETLNRRQAQNWSQAGKLSIQQEYNDASNLKCFIFLAWLWLIWSVCLQGMLNPVGLYIYTLPDL